MGPLGGRFLRPAGEPVTDTQVKDMVAGHESRITNIETLDNRTIIPTQQAQQDKIVKMDSWLSGVAEPVLNRHDDDLAGLKTTTIVHEKSLIDLAGNQDAILTNLPQIADSSVNRWVDANLDAKMDGWWSKQDISPKTDTWFDKAIIGPRVRGELQLPDGIENYDVGELLGMFNNMGKKLQPLPSMNVSQPALYAIVNPAIAGGVGTIGGATIAPPTGGTGGGTTGTGQLQGGTGGTGGGTLALGGTTGIAQVGKTITNVAMIEERMTLLLQTYWGNLVGLNYAWNDAMLPTLQVVKMYRDQWNMAASFASTYSNMLSLISGGTYAGMDTHIQAMIASNLASFKATVQSQMQLPLEQVTFLSGMITTRGGLNGDKPTAHVLNSIDFYFNNFKGRANLEAALAEHTSYFNELNNTWWDLSSTKFRIKAAQDTWIGLDGTRNTIRDYFDGWMTDFDLGSRVGDLLNGDPLFKDAWLGLKDKYLDLPKISGHGKALMDVRDRTGNVKDRITALRDEIKAREDEFNTAASKVGTLRSAMSSYITTYGWASLFGGIYGAKAAEAYIFVDVMSKLDGVLDNIVDAFDKVSNTYAGMRLKIEDIATEVGNLQSTLKTRDIRN